MINHTNDGRREGDPRANRKARRRCRLRHRRRGDVGAVARRARQARPAGDVRRDVGPDGRRPTCAGCSGTSGTSWARRWATKRSSTRWPPSIARGGSLRWSTRCSTSPQGRKAFERLAERPAVRQGRSADSGMTSLEIKRIRRRSGRKSRGSGSAQYTPGELQQIRDEFVTGRTPHCPRCNAWR